MAIEDFEYTEMTASESVEKNMTDYAKYTINSKFPHFIDGLKLVHRRILYVLKSSDKMNKVLSITGEVMKIHPHGDLSISDAIVALMQPFNMPIPLVYSDRNIGSYSEPRAAAPRYLPACSHPFAREVYFNKITTKALVYVETETAEGFEPLYLIPAIPMTLMTYTMGLALGYKSEVFPMNFKDMIEFTKKWIDMYEKQGSIKYEKFFKYMYYDFPSACLIRNKKQMFESFKELNTEPPIIVDGVMKLHRQKIVVHTIPPGLSFTNTVCGKLRDQLRDKKSFIYQHIQKIDSLDGKDTGILQGHVEIVLKRGISPFDVLDEIKRIISFTQRKTPAFLFVNNDSKMVKMTRFELIKKWYDERTKSIRTELNYKQNDLIDEKMKYEALIIYVDNAKEIHSIFHNSKDVNDALINLEKRFDLTRFQSNYLTSIKLATATKRGRQELVDKLKQIERELADLQNQYKNIHERIKNEVEFIYNKFKQYSERKSKFPDFYGAIIFNKGVIQVWTEKELIETLREFKPTNTVEDVIIYYNNNNKFQYVIKNGKITTNDILDFPKEFTCDKFITCKYKLKHTLCFNAYNRINIQKNTLLTNRDNVAYVTDNFILIQKNGLIKHLNIKDINKYKTDYPVVAVIPYIEDNMFVLLHNSKDGNKFRAAKLIDNFKINMPVTGITEMVTFGKIDESISIILNKKYVKSSKQIMLTFTGNALLQNKDFRLFAIKELFHISSLK